MKTLGQAYVQIMPSAKGISGSIQKTLNPEATAAGKSAGSNIASSISKSLDGLGNTFTKKITLPALGAVTAVAGLVGTLGFKRLVGMDVAQAKLQGLGYESEQLETIMNNARNAVQGTTFATADGAYVAAGALAAGVKEGAELERYISLVGDAAIGAGVPIEEMAQIFNRIQSEGKLTRNELEMINYRLPGFGNAMIEHVGASSTEAFNEMLRSGEISTDDMLNVMEDFAGGMSEAYAGTWSGLKDNIISNIGIIGEALLEGLFKDGKKGMAEFLDFLRNSDGLKEWATDTGEKIRDFTHTVIDGAKQMIDWWQKLSPETQELAEKIAIFGTIGAISIGPLLKIVAPLVTVIGALVPVFAALFSPVGLIIGAIALLVAGIVYLWQTSEGFRDIIGVIWEGIQNIFETALGFIVGYVQEIWGGLVEWWSGSGEMIKEAAQNVWSFISSAIEVAMDVIMSIMQFVWPFVEMLIVQVWENIKGVIDGALKVITGVIDFFAALFTGNWSALWDSIKRIISGAVQFLWNAVQLWFVGRIIGVVRRFAGLLRGVISGVWNAVRGLFSSGLGAIRNLVTSGLNAVRGTFTNIMNGLRGIVSGAFGRVRSAISNGMTNAFNAVKGFFGKFKNAGKNIVTSIADGIKGAIGKVTGAIKNVTQKIRDFLPFSPPKTGPLIDIMDVEWGATIGAGIEGGEKEVAKAMDNLLAFDLTKKATFSNPQNTTTSDTSLLIEQNKLLKKLVDKDTNTYLDGKAISKSVSNRQGDAYNMSNYMRGNRLGVT